MLQHGLWHAQQLVHQAVHGRGGLGHGHNLLLAARSGARAIGRVHHHERGIQRLVRVLAARLADLQVAHAHHGLVDLVLELELNLPLDLRRVAHLGVVHKGLPRSAARRQRARGGKLEALNDGGLAAAIGAHNHSERLGKHDRGSLLRAKGANATDGQRGNG